MLPTNRIWVVDISYITGDTMVRTFDGDVIVSEDFDETVRRLKDCGMPLCVLVRRESDTRVAVPLSRIVRIERSEMDGEGAPLVITLDGRLCVEGDISDAVRAVADCGGSVCEYHKKLDDGNPTYILKSQIRGIIVSRTTGDTVVLCGTSKIVVTESFEDAQELTNSDSPPA